MKLSSAVNLLIALAVACGANRAVPRESGFTVRLPATEFLDQLDDRERRDQMRDWGVLATLAHEGATPDQMAQATYQMPPVRLPYLDELYSFTCGRGRRVYFGERLLLFVDADDPDRTATIARLADQVRMELGEVPRSAEIYVVEDQRNAGMLRISRSADVDGVRLFSAEYGYVGAEVSDATELASWLSKIDDLSRVKIEAGKLVVGGRRFAISRTEGVAVDDIAALYQAGKQIQDRRAGVERELEDLEAKYKEMLQGRIPKLSDADVRAALARLETEVKAVAQRMGPQEPGFSLDPQWVPAENGKHPLMLARLKRLAADPCGEVSRIGGLASKLLAFESDETRRSGEAWVAQEIATVKLSASTCTWLHGFVGKLVAAVTASLEAASPKDWRYGFGPYYRFLADIGVTLDDLTMERQRAMIAVHETLYFYDFEARVQCARYDEIEGTELSMTLFYTDLLAKLWHAVDYGHSAPLRAIPGFLTEPRVNMSPAFADEMKRLPSTRIWFAPRMDGWSRIAGEPASDLAFAHRLSRVYAAGSDPARPGTEGIPNEVSRLSVGWMHRHFEEIADHEQQYHRQNQIMKWSVVTATMIETHQGPTFLASVGVDRTTRFFPWLAEHRDQLRFQEPVPERQSVPGTECLPILRSYPFSSADSLYFVTGGVSLAGSELVKATPTVNLRLPRGHRVVPATDAEPLPYGEIEGQTVLFKNATAARLRSSTGPIDVRGVSVRFEKIAGVPALILDSKAGVLATVEIGPTEGGVRIDLQAGPVEHVRAALDHPRGDTVISFEARPERVVRHGDTLVEVRRIDTAPADGSMTGGARDVLSPDDSVIAIAADPFNSGTLQQARTVQPNDLYKRMDEYAWQAITPGSGPTHPPAVQFRNEPPPAGTREVLVRGVDGVASTPVTRDGEVFFARPSKPDARADWHDLADRADANAAFRALVGQQGEIDLSASAKVDRQHRAADRLALCGRLEDAALLFERTIPAEPTTIEDHVRATLRDLGFRNATAAKNRLQALTARKQEISPETRSLLVESLRSHGDRDVATFIDANLQGKTMLPGQSLVAERGRVVVEYDARGPEKFLVGDAKSDIVSPVKYFDRRLLVGSEQFEPDFSGSISRWMHDPRVRVREMNVIEPKPGVIVDTATKQELLRARGSAVMDIADTLPNKQRVFVIEPAACRPTSNNAKRTDAKDCVAE